MSRSEPDERNERQVARRNDTGSQRSVSQYRAPEADNIIRRVIEMIDTSPGLPMSSSVRVNKEEVVAILSDALSQLPEELRTARWLLKEREEFLAKQHREGEEMIAAASVRVTRGWLTVRRSSRQPRSGPHRSSRRPRTPPEGCSVKPRTSAIRGLLASRTRSRRFKRPVSIGRKRLAAPTIEEAELGSGSAAGHGGGPASGAGSRGEGRGEGRTASRGESNDPAADIFDQDR